MLVLVLESEVLVLVLVNITANFAGVLEDESSPAGSRAEFLERV